MIFTFKKKSKMADVIVKIKSLGKKNNVRNSVYSMVSCSDLTSGSLEVWGNLPEEIKFDPSLAPFKNLYEQKHGKLECSTFSNEPEEELQETLCHTAPELDPITENSEDIIEKSTINGDNRFVEQMHVDDNKKNKSTRKKQFDRAVRAAKLTALVAGWIFITASLMLNSEKTDIVLHTAVRANEVKEYALHSSEERLKVLITLNGPFLDSVRDVNTSSVDVLQIWLRRRFEMNGIWIYQNSTIWTVYLKNEEVIDFSPSETESSILVLENNKHGLYNGTTLCMNTTGSTVPLTISYQMDPLDEEDGIIYATILLLTLYILIIFEIVNRTIAALLSSSLGVAVLSACGMRPTLSELVSWLDSETLLLLLSMMLLVAVLADTGLFDYLAVKAFEVTGGRTWPLINCLCLFTAVCSTFLDNVTTVLLMTPVTIRLCEVMQLNPVPVLMSMVIFSNVGGAATPVGDPPNVIIASHPSVLRENLNFATFTLHMGVGILLVCVQTYVQLRYMFRDINTLRHSVPTDIQEMRQEVSVWRRAAASLSSYSRDEDIVRKALEKKVERLNALLKKKEAGGGSSKTDPKFSSTLAQMKENYRIRDRPLLIKSVMSVLFVVIVFFLHAIPELERLSLGWTALLGALLLLLLAEREDLEPVLARVEWSTLLFFAALFVLMEVLSKLGLISWIGGVTESIILKVDERSRLAVAIMLILWVSGIASAFVDNIPLTTMMVRVMAALAHPNGLGLPLAPLAWALSFGACLGGNGTLIGASANVVCAGVAEQHGYRFTFLQYLKIGFPIMIGNLLIASMYLLICHCIFIWH